MLLKNSKPMHGYTSFAKILIRVKVNTPHLPFSHSKGRWHPNWHPTLSTLTKSHTWNCAHKSKCTHLQFQVQNTQWIAKQNMVSNQCPLSFDAIWISKCENDIPMQFPEDKPH
jgi:hypothetical protein